MYLSSCFLSPKDPSAASLQQGPVTLECESRLVGGITTISKAESLSRGKSRGLIVHAASCGRFSSTIFAAAEPISYHLYVTSAFAIHFPRRIHVGRCPCSSAKTKNSNIEPGASSLAL